MEPILEEPPKACKDRKAKKAYIPTHIMSKDDLKVLAEYLVLEKAKNEEEKEHNQELKEKTNKIDKIIKQMYNPEFVIKNIKDLHKNTLEDDFYNDSYIELIKNNFPDYYNQLESVLFVISQLKK